MPTGATCVATRDGTRGTLAEELSPPTVRRPRPRGPPAPKPADLADATPRSPGRYALPAIAAAGLALLVGLGVTHAAPKPDTESNPQVWWGPDGYRGSFWSAPSSLVGS